jgi:PKD repeat protein
MRRNVLMKAFVSLFAVVALCSCNKDEDDKPKSTACDIVSFSVNGVAWDISGANITHVYPSETAATSMTPTVTLSPYATINPPANEAQNFFAPQGVIYTVTAEDGTTTKTYTAKATVQEVAVTGVALNQNTLALIAGSSVTLVATVAPDSASNKEVTWSSDATAVATVSNTGTVTAVAGGTATITVTAAEGGKTATCAVTVVPSTVELIALCRQLYQQVCADYLQIDNQYSTLAARQGVTFSSNFLYGFWQKSYQTIQYHNLLLERLDAETNLSEAERHIIEGNILGHRATVYFYLKTLFDGVPLILSSGYRTDEHSRVSEQEMNEFIYDGFNSAIHLLPTGDSIDYMYAIVASQDNNAYYAYEKIMDAISRLIDSGLFSFTDTNGDVIISVDEYAANIIMIRMNLLVAEASLKAGYTAEAALRINTLYQLFRQPPLSPTTTADGIRTAIRNIFSNCDAGMKYLNIVRWDLASEWGHRILLPIPQQALEENPNLTQNQGW